MATIDLALITKRKALLQGEFDALNTRSAKLQKAFDADISRMAEIQAKWKELDELEKIATGNRVQRRAAAKKKPTRT